MMMKPLMKKKVMMMKSFKMKYEKNMILLGIKEEKRRGTLMK